MFVQSFEQAPLTMGEPMEIDRRAGHLSVAFTYDRYRHLFPEADTMAACKLDAVRTAGLAAEVG